MSLFLIFILGDIKEHNSPNNQEKPPATGTDTDTEIQSQTRTQPEHESQLQSNTVQGNQVNDFHNGDNINRDLHELHKNEFDDYEFQDENNFELSRRNNLRNPNSQNYGRSNDNNNNNNNNNNGDDDGDVDIENERMSESYTKYISQNNLSRRQGNQEQQQQQVMLRNNFNKNNHQNFRTTSPQRPLTEINLRNTKFSRNPSEFDIVSQNDFNGYEGRSREKNGQYENRELDASRSSSSISSRSRNGQQYNQNIESNERIRSNQSQNPNFNLNHNSRNFKNKSSK